MISDDIISSTGISKDKPSGVGLTSKAEKVVEYAGGELVVKFYERLETSFEVERHARHIKT